jgi:CysZ protein
MVAIIFRSAGDLFDARIGSVFLKSMLVTLLIFLGIGAAVGWAFMGADPCSWIEESCPLGATGGGLGAMAVMLLAIWFLFPAIALGVLCAYIDHIIAIVEERHYPRAAVGARSAHIGRLLGLGVKSAARVLIYNLIALPLYVLLLFTVVGPAILFIVVNGLAFGRDLGEMVAVRHGDRAMQRQWLATSRGGRFIIGTAVTALFMVPIANLLAPILGAAMTVHFYHRTQAV